MSLKSISLENWKGTTKSFDELQRCTLFYGANAAGKTAILSAADFALTGCVPLPTGERKTSISSAAKFAGTTGENARGASVSASVEHNGRRLLIERYCDIADGSASQRLSINGQSGTVSSLQAQIAQLVTVLDPESILRMKPADLRAYLCGITGVEGDSPLPALEEKWGNRLSLPATRASWIDAILYAINAASEHVKDADRLRKDAERDLQRAPSANAIGVGGVEAARKLRADADARLGKLLREEQEAEASASARSNLTQTRTLAVAELAKLEGADYPVPPAPEVGAKALRDKADRLQREYAASVADWRKRDAEIGAAAKELDALTVECERRMTEPISSAVRTLEGVLCRIEADHEVRADILAAKNLLDPFVVPITKAQIARGKSLTKYVKENPPTPCPEPPDVSELLRQATEADEAQGAHDLARAREQKRQSRIAELKSTIAGYDRRLAEELPSPPAPEAVEAAKTAANEAAEAAATAELAAKAEQSRATLSERAKFHAEELDAYKTMREELQAALDAALADKIRPFSETVQSALSLMQDGAQMLLESGTERGRLVLSMLASWRGERMDYESTMSGAERRLFWIGVAIAHAKLASVSGPILLAELGDLDFSTLRRALDFIDASGVSCLATTHILDDADVHFLEGGEGTSFAMVKA